MVQGFGNVGSYSALISQQEGGAKIVGIAEYDGTLVNPDGIDIAALIEHKKEHRTITTFPGGKLLEDKDDWVSFDCDIMIPAALENQIHGKNAGKIKAKIIAEAANGPITAEGDEILLKKGVVILPDCLLYTSPSPRDRQKSRMPSSA